MMKFHIEGNDMTTDTPMAGHNNPPSPIDDINARFEDTRMAAENWADGTPVENEAQMKAVDVLRKEARAWRLELEAGQKSATAPMYDAYKAEMAKWKVEVDGAKLIEECLVAAVGDFKKAEAAKKEAVRIAAWQEAERLRKEAEAKLATANLSSIDAQRDAQEAMAAADAAREAASVAQKDTVKGMRKVVRHEVTDHRTLLHHIAANDKPAVTAFIDEWARKNHKDNRNAPGLRVWDDQEAF